MPAKIKGRLPSGKTEDRRPFSNTGSTLRGFIVKRKGKERKLVVYPAMWKEPQQEDTVYVSNAYIKYAKPYAVQKKFEFLMKN